MCLDDGLLQMYVEGQLKGPEAELVRVHLAQCERCRREAACYKQLMWDLEHPEEEPLPRELEAMQDALLRAWTEHERDRRSRQRTRILPHVPVPSWAGYSVLWARRVPGARLVETAVARAASRLFSARLPRIPWLRNTKRSGGGRR